MHIHMVEIQHNWLEKQTIDIKRWQANCMDCTAVHAENKFENLLKD